VFLLHDDKRVENNVAKEHAGNGQNWDYDLSEASNLPVPFITPVAPEPIRIAP